MNTIDLPNKLKLEIDKGLPGAEAHKLMAPLGRVVNQDFDQIKKTAKHSAVLIVLFPYGGEWFTVLMERNQYNGHHSGQISFPGGRLEELDKDLKETAFREFHEEMGVLIPSTNLIGELSELYIPPSNFYVKPYIAYVQKPMEFIPEQKEVFSVLPMSLNRIFQPNSKTKEKVQVSGTRMSINAPAYRIDKSLVWGATAMMLSELELLIKRIE